MTDTESTKIDYTEREQTVRVALEIPFYGSDVHLDTLKERLHRILVLHFNDIKITDIEGE